MDGGRRDVKPGYDARSDTALYTSHSWRAEPRSRSAPAHHLFFIALNLFRLLERPEMIPTALWGCCRLAPSVLIHGAERADGVTRERLELADLELCWKVQRHLVEETVELMTRMCAHIIARTSETKCQKRDKCIEGLRVFLQGIRTCMPTLAFVDPLDGFNPLLKVNPSPISTLMCTICVNSLKEKHTELRKMVWQKLPEIMGMTIEGWGPQGAT